MSLEIEVELSCHPDLPFIVIEGFLGKANLISCLLQSIQDATLLWSIMNPLPKLEVVFGLPNRPLLRFSIDGSFPALGRLFSLCLFSKLEIEFIFFLPTQLYKYIFRKGEATEKLTNFCCGVHIEYLSMCEEVPQMMAWLLKAGELLNVCVRLASEWLQSTSYSLNILFSPVIWFSKMACLSIFAIDSILVFMRKGAPPDIKYRTL